MLVKVHDLRRYTCFDFAADFVRYDKTRLYEYPADTREGDLMDRLVAVFCSVSFWVQNAGNNGNKKQVFNPSSPPPETNVSFNLSSIGVVV